MTHFILQMSAIKSVLTLCLNSYTDEIYVETSVLYCMNYWQMH